MSCRFQHIHEILNNAKTTEIIGEQEDRVEYRERVKERERAWTRTVSSDKHMARQGATEKERAELFEIYHKRAQHERLLPLIFCPNKWLIFCEE